MTDLSMRGAGLERGDWLLYKLLPPAANPSWCAGVSCGDEAVLTLVESRDVLMQDTGAIDAVQATGAVGGVEVFAAFWLPACHACILLVCDSRAAATASISAGKWARPDVWSLYRLVISVRVCFHGCPSACRRLKPRCAVVGVCEVWFAFGRAPLAGVFRAV